MFFYGFLSIANKCEVRQWEQEGILWMCFVTYVQYINNNIITFLKGKYWDKYGQYDHSLHQSLEFNCLNTCPAFIILANSILVILSCRSTMLEWTFALAYIKKDFRYNFIPQKIIPNYCLCNMCDSSYTLHIYMMLLEFITSINISKCKLCWIIM